MTWVAGAYTVAYGKRDLIKNRAQPPLGTGRMLQGQRSSTTRAHAQPWRYVFEHCMCRCVANFHDKKLHRQVQNASTAVPFRSVLVREAICRQIEPRIATRKHIMFERK